MNDDALHRYTLADTFREHRRSYPGRAATIDGDTRLTLGPEAIIGAQRVWLRLDERRIAVATDGLGPFEPQPGDAP